MGLDFTSGSGTLGATRDSFVGLSHANAGTVVLGNLTGPTRALGSTLDVFPGATGIGANSGLIGKIAGSTLKSTVDVASTPPPPSPLNATHVTSPVATDYRQRRWLRQGRYLHVDLRHPLGQRRSPTCPRTGAASASPPPVSPTRTRLRITRPLHQHHLRCHHVRPRHRRPGFRPERTPMALTSAPSGKAWASWPA